MTPGRRAALKKAQLASARKRKGHKKPIGKLGHSAAIVGGAILGGNAAALVSAKAGRLGLAGPASIAGAVGGGIVAHKQIKKTNKKRLAKRTVKRGHSAQKGRKIA